MKRFPKVSIITPSFNQADFLESTIQSVLGQNYPNLEYIIIDGGSVDGSVDIIMKYTKHLAYWVSEQDRGQSEAINKGFRKATGKYVNWLNSDDVLLDNCLTTLVDTLESHKNVDVVFGNSIFIDKNGTELFRRLEVPFDKRVVTYGISYIPQPSALFRREILSSVGLLDESFHYCMDHEFWLRVLDAGGKFLYVDNFLSGYRMHYGSKGVIRPKVIGAERLRIKRKFGIRIKNRYLEALVHGFLYLLYRLKRKYYLRFIVHKRLEFFPGSWKLSFLKARGKI